MNDKPIKKYVYAIAFIPILLWASSFVGIKDAVYYFSPGALVLARLIIASVIMLFIYVFITKNNNRIGYIPAIFAAFCGIIGIMMFNLFINYGEKTMDPAIASFISSQSPVIAIMMAVIFLGEKISYWQLYGLIFCVIGTLIIMYSQAQHFSINIGIIYLLFAALCAASYSILQKILLKKVPILSYISFAIWGATIASLFFMDDLVIQMNRAPSFVILDVIYLGIFPTAAAYAIWGYCFLKIEASKIVIYTYFMPVFTAIMSFAFFHQIPKLITIIGGLISLMGVMISNIPARKVVNSSVEIFAISPKQQ